MTESDIQFALYQKYQQRQMVMPNVYVLRAGFDTHESDFLTVTANGYIDEYEIKISRQDFKADLKKHRHLAYTHLSPWTWAYRPYGWWGKTGPYTEIGSKARYPNRFWYVVPEGLIDVEDLPEHAGLLWVINTNPLMKHPPLRIKKVRAAPILHHQKADDRLRMRIMQKAYYRFIDNWRREGLKSREEAG